MNSKLFSSNNTVNEKENRPYLLAWGVYHLSILALFLLFLLTHKGQSLVDTDLFNMLPKPLLSHALTKADSLLTQKTAQNVFILCANKDFNKAKEAAASVYNDLKDSDKFVFLSLYQDTATVSPILNYIKDRSPLLLSSSDIESINTSPSLFLEGSLSRAYSPFSIVDASTDEDPFMITPLVASNFFSSLQGSSPNMNVKDGVLYSYNPESSLYYVMLRGVLSKKGAALASKSNAVVSIYSSCKKASGNGTRFIYSGTTFHSYTSSSNATREVSIISSVSLLVVLIILLSVFHTPLPIFCSIASILIASITAIISTILCFGRMHILSIVFGTSLIGSSIDYSLHYFINWKARHSITTSIALRAFLIKGLSLSLASTLLCYFVLLFTPFSLLKQMAVFSIAGILSTFLSVIALYPYIRIPEKRSLSIKWHSVLLIRYNKRVVGRIVISFMFLISLLLLFLFRDNFAVHNNVKTLYKMSEKEAQDEREAGSVLNYNPSAWYIVSAEDTNSLLLEEEKLGSSLQKVNEGREKAGFLSTASFIPSIDKQLSSLKAIESLLPFVKEQYLTLGYTEEEAVEAEAKYKDNFYKKYRTLLKTSIEESVKMAEEEAKVKEESVKKTEEGAKETEDPPGFITLNNAPSALLSYLSTSYLGEIDGKYYSVLLPVSVTDNEEYKKLAENNPNLYFMNKVETMNCDLDKLSCRILIMFIAVIVILFIVLKLFYTLKQTLKIVSIPILIILFTFAVFSALNIKLEFFSIVGLILVLGLGLDYVIYMMENEKRVLQGKLQEVPDKDALLEPYAILLSFITTAISFASLSLSAFIPVHNIGLSIFIGLTVSYLSTFFYTRET